MQKEHSHREISLRDQVAIVTGASSGIGESIAEELVKRGVHVALSARREERLQAIAQRLVSDGYGETLVVPCDVRQPQDVQELVNKTLQQWGRISIVVANAGVGYRVPIIEGDIERWKVVLDTNVYGLALTLKYAVPSLLEYGGGHVVVMSSNASRVITAGGGIYCGSKVAANAIAEALRQEIASQGVRVTLIEPGIVSTGFAEVAGYSPQVVAALEQTQPLQPKDVAQAVLYALEQPASTTVAEILVYPTRQAGQPPPVR